MEGRKKLKMEHKLLHISNFNLFFEKIINLEKEKEEFVNKYLKNDENINEKKNGFCIIMNISKTNYLKKIILQIYYKRAKRNVKSFSFFYNLNSNHLIQVEEEDLFLKNENYERKIFDRKDLLEKIRNYV